MQVCNAGQHGVLWLEGQSQVDLLIAAAMNAAENEGWPIISEAAEHAGERVGLICRAFLRQSLALNLAVHMPPRLAQGS